MSQPGVSVDGAVQAVGVVFGLAVLAAGLAALVALAYRWYTRERVPGGLPVVVGLSAVAVYLNTTTALGQAIGGVGDPLSVERALFNVTAFAVGAAAASGGTRAGDRAASDVFAATGQDAREEVGRIVRTVGRVTSIELPEEIDDVVGYDPVPEGTKEQLAGRTFLFPRRLTVSDLEGRLAARLKADYGVGHVDVDLSGDGTVEYLAVGSRVAGIGPTLPPETTAVAARADPAFAASSGDLVQVWSPDGGERLLTAELRGVAGEVVTLAVDAADTPKLDADTRYRLVTLPVETRPDREFVSLLRAADETMGVVSVGTGSALAGQPVGSLAVAVVAVRPRSGGVEPLPRRDRVTEAGDSLYAVARPEALRKLEEAASAGADGGESAVERPPGTD